MAGDPANFSDPVGLCKDENGEERHCIVYSTNADLSKLRPETLATLQEIATAADRDLGVAFGVISTGFNFVADSPKSPSHLLLLTDGAQSMKALVTLGLTSLLVAAGPVCAQQASPLQSVEFRAENRDQTARGVEAISFWSFYDHAESVEIVVQLGAPTPGIVLSEVKLGVARIVWEDGSKEVPNYEATVARAYWLPAIATSRTQTADWAGEIEGVVATVQPDDLLRQLRENDPEILLTALWARSCFVGDGGNADGTVNCTEKEIPLYMAH